MTSLLQQLENNEAILLMYLADELPAEDRAEVDQLLATDAVLRADLERLAMTQQAVQEAMSQLDIATRPPISPAVAVRQMTREVRRWQVERLSGQVQEPARKSGLRYPWWVYPLATAASVLVAFVVWRGSSSDGPSGIGEPLNPWPMNSELVSDVPEASTLEDIQVAQHLENSFDNADDLLQEVDTDAPLNAAEQQLVALRENAGYVPPRVVPIDYVWEENTVGR